MRVVVTGGAGFIGSHVVDALVDRGDTCIVFDACVAPVHDGPPSWANRSATYVWSDPRSTDAWAAAAQADVLVHLAALTGTAQSMYEVQRYTDANVGLTAFLAEQLVRGELRPRSIVFASTRAVYGDGVGACPVDGRVALSPRRPSDLRAGRWDPTCGACGREARPLPLREDDPVSPLTPYAASKLAGEHLLRSAANATGVPLCTLRLFNVYGRRQSPTNPYVGVVSAFADAALAGRTLDLYEDGGIVRDLVHVDDVTAAIVAAVSSDVDDTINVGSGTPTTLRALATVVAHAAGSTTPDIAISGSARVGDPRSVTADISRARRLLRWSPRTSLARGCQELIAWLSAVGPSSPEPAADAASELVRHGLLVGGGR